MLAASDVDTLRDVIQVIANETGQWAGIPMPLDGQDLVIEPTFTARSALIGPEPPIPVDDPADAIEVRNRFWSTRYRTDAVIYAQHGKIYVTVMPRHMIKRLLMTLACSSAWGIKQETTAFATLAGMLNAQQLKTYLTTGCFAETSPRSGVRYLFRRLRPTLAMSEATGNVKVLAALCMHPIGHYAGTFAGVMCPTDDVIAHLCLMRGDERLFWARCNQHAPYRPEAGIE